MRRLPMLLVAIVLVLGACGDDEDDATGPADAPSGEVETGDGAAGDGEADGDAAVAIEDFAYDPEVVEVTVGTTVVWTNHDTVSHTVTAGEPDSPADGFNEAVGPDETVEVTFGEAGTFPYYCTIHPRMTGEVVVS